jgi:hypothetical protein
VRRAAARRRRGRVLVALMLPLCLTSLIRSCNRNSHVRVCCPKCEMDAEVASLTDSGAVSATARSVPGCRGWGALLWWPAVLARGQLAWSEVVGLVGGDKGWFDIGLHVDGGDGQGAGARRRG